MHTRYSLSCFLFVWISRSRLHLTVAVCSVLLASVPLSGASSLADLSIEELMNVSVASVSKMKQRLGDAAAAIAVLSNDDLLRSGATSVPEALRLVPGMNVTSENSSEWAISARGFNDVFSRRLLVLIDGRAVYNPIFSWVPWDLQQPMLEDLDRIEVIRGPGAALWGANAVNGVINVVSRSARDTQGGLVYGGIGEGHASASGARFGGKLGANTFFRAFGSLRSDDSHLLADGRSAQDAWRAQHGGFRVDHYPDVSTHITWQADATGMERVNDTIESSNFNTLGRWTRQWSEKSNTEVQVYYDRVFRDAAIQARWLTRTFDFSTQHVAELGSRQTIVGGFGYRRAANRVAQTTPLVTVRTPKANLDLYNAFLQDEIHLVPDRLAVTVGLKLEHNDFTGLEFQPTLRAAYKPTEDQTLWAAVSRAVRTPNFVEGKDAFGFTASAPFVGPGGGLYLPTGVGNGDPDAEVLWAFEAGYRAQLSNRMSVDVAAFNNDYDKLIHVAGVTRLVPGAPLGTAEIASSNVLTARSWGGEASMVFAATDTLRFTVNYTGLLMRVMRRAPVPAELLLDDGARSAPKHQFFLRTSYDITTKLSLDLQLGWIGSTQGVSSYTTADIRVGWLVTRALELSVVGQSLLEAQHLEQGVVPFISSSEVPRGAYARATWRF